ncbi:MAG: hypothetical protein ACK5U5_08165 [Burkholderiales bacterium]|jgi:hypothetical protein
MKNFSSPLGSKRVRPDPAMQLMIGQYFSRITVERVIQLRTPADHLFAQLLQALHNPAFLRVDALDKFTLETAAPRIFSSI